MITLSEKGVFVQCEDYSDIIPAHIRNVADVSGAGDTVIAVASLVYADGKSSYSAIVAIKIANAKAPKLYPNPANNILHIVAGTEAIKSINIFDATGKVILRIPGSTMQTAMDIPVAVLSNGIYFVEITTTNSVFSEKLIIQK